MECKYCRKQCVKKGVRNEIYSDYLLGFRSQIDVIKSIESTFVLTEKQKGLTTELYALCDTVMGKMEFLRTYVKPTGLDYRVITTVNKQLRNRNVEGAVKTGKEAKRHWVISKLMKLT